MAFKKDDGKVRKHPPLEKDWTRVLLPEIKASTGKATLFDFKDTSLKGNGMIWIPSSCYKIRYRPRFTPLPGDDADDVLDIKTWFYEKEIEK
jgi:hypothetical protein